LLKGKVVERMRGVVKGGFKDEDVRKVLNLSEKEQPLYIIPIGKK
jgi:hypothetical protein